MRKIVVIGYAASVLLACGMGWGLDEVTQSARASASAVDHTLQVLREITGVEASVARAESAQRGYLLYGQDSFLDERDREMANARVHAGAVASLSAGNPSQQEKVKALSTLLDERLARMRANAQARQALGASAPVLRAPTFSGQRITAHVYEVTGSLSAEELRLLGVRREEEARQFTLVRYALFSTIIVLLALAIPGWAVSMRAARGRERAERSMLQLAESLPGAVFQYRVSRDGTSRYELLSTATERLRGVDRAAALRDSNVILDTIVEPDRSQVLAKLAAYQGAMTPIVVDYRARVGEQIRWIRTVAAPRAESDGSVVWSGHWDDVTTRRQLEEQLRLSKEEADAANRAKTTFLATMSHEIRTPMNGVLGLLELMSLTRLDREQQATLRVVRESGRSLLRIIDDILDFSKVEAGKLDLVPERTSVRDVVDRVWAMYSGTASSKGLLLRRDVDARISPVVIADPVRLQQILGNFVSNALKFTSAGGASISASLLEHIDHHEVIRFVVEDSGPGLSAEQRDRLFKPFSQVHNQSISRHPGTGLGLSIAQRLAALMNGTIEMDSEVGRGTRIAFTVTLPVGDGEAPSIESREPRPAPSVREPPSVEQAEKDGRLILVVDDHPINRMVLVRQVNALGFAAESADNGREALEMWTTGRFSLLLTDCNMPEMDGYQLAERIRQREKATSGKRITIIACTANALGGEAEKCFAAGMDDYVAKPISLEQLAGKLERWLPAESPPDPVTRMEVIHSADAVLEEKVLWEISGGNEELARDLLRRFQRYNREDLQLLREAIAQADTPQIVTYSHRMKGSSRTIGANRLAQVIGRIERHGLVSDIHAAASEFSTLESELARLDQHIRRMTG